jgi:hypothetical protein
MFNFQKKPPHPQAPVPSPTVQRSSKSAKKGSKKEESGTMTPTGITAATSRLCEPECLFSLQGSFAAGQSVITTDCRAYVSWLEDTDAIEENRIGPISNEEWNAPVFEGVIDCGAVDYTNPRTDYFDLSDYGSNLYVETGAGGAAFSPSGSPIEVCWEFPEPTSIVVI